MSFRTSLIILNLVAIGVVLAIIAWRVISVRRNPERTTPQNLTPYLRDEDLEGRRLERALGWSLLFALVIAIALPVYFIVEPTRESAAKDAFHEASVERGAVLFSNKQSKAYDSHEVAALRRLPRRRRHRRCRAVHAPARVRPLPHQAEPGQRRHPRVPADPGLVAGAGAQHASCSASTAPR